MNRATGITAGRKLPLVAGLALAILLGGDVTFRFKVMPSVTASAAITALLTYLWLLLSIGILAYRKTSGITWNGHVGDHGVRRVTRASKAIPATLWIFLSWAVLVTLLNGVTVGGLQNLSCYFLFIGTALIVSGVASEGSSIGFIKGVVIVGWVRAVMYGVDLLLSGFGASGVSGPRVFAIQALLIMAVVIPSGRGEKMARLLPYVLFLEIVLSGSRTAMVAAALLFVWSPFTRGQRGFRPVRSLVTVGLLATLGYLALTHLPQLRNRFLAEDVTLINGTPVNTSGRDLLWEVVIAHAQTSPWAGHGAGSATAIIREIVRTAGEPHSDYLRFWNDFGFIGLGFWLLGYMGIAVRCWRRARARSSGDAGVHYAALMALLAIGLLAVTDNVLVYFYAMVPFGALIGLSLACPESVEVSGSSNLKGDSHTGLHRADKPVALAR
ncbi:O-antigen ligase [Streptomyces sp. V4I23]|uniref:O-antigen ligase family protein n=1 Tax=Streptomyces sp. V4I23 TaxID=3042282 RepID=UPI0027895D45|nr:O-antigen ligase family protein [Streptomyces sp. V4I23]MDQ1006968.1 O-antigen ligase [Streptomyces sp. V4I23]